MLSVIHKRGDKVFAAPGEIVQYHSDATSQPYFSECAREPVIFLCMYAYTHKGLCCCFLLPLLNLLAQPVVICTFRFLTHSLPLITHAHNTHCLASPMCRHSQHGATLTSEKLVSRSRRSTLIFVMDSLS